MKNPCEVLPLSGLTCAAYHIVSRRLSILSNGFLSDGKIVPSKSLVEFLKVILKLRVPAADIFIWAGLADETSCKESRIAGQQYHAMVDSIF